jgi:hypothetical protein
MDRAAPARRAGKCAATGDLMQVRKQIEVTGIVQGVGFRPYIYRLAARPR